MRTFFGPFADAEIAYRRERIMADYGPTRRIAVGGISRSIGGFVSHRDGRSSTTRLSVDHGGGGCPR